MSFQIYVPISKIDKDTRMVWGYASTPTLDLQGERVSIEALRDALPDYMEWANIREMHQPSAVGVAKEATIDEKGLYVGSKVVDDNAWKKVLEEVYKGYSIGGERTAKVGDTITGLKLIEISLVDRPANPDCKIEVEKVAQRKPSKTAAAGMDDNIGVSREEVGFLGRLLQKLAFGKSGDGFSHPAGSLADPLKPASDKGGDTTVTPPGPGPALAEPAVVQGKTAEEVAEEERKGAAAKEAEKAAAAARAAGEGSSLAKSGCDSGLWSPTSNAHTMAAIFDLLISLSRSLRYEADQEVGDEKDYSNARKVSVLAQTLGGLLAECASEQVDEEKQREAARKALTSAGINQESINMSKSIFEGAGAVSAGDGNPELAKRFAAAHKVALGKAALHLGKAQKCMGKAMKHAAAIGKLCKAGGPVDLAKAEEGSLPHHAAALGEALSDAAEHHEMAAHHVGKANSAWTGEHAQAPMETEGDLYTHDDGLTALSQSHLTGGDIPDYDPTHPVKAAGINAAIAAALAPMQKRFDDLTTELAKAKEDAALQRGRAEAFASMPAGAPRARLFTLDKGALVAAGGEKPNANEIMMEGVDLDSAATDPDVASKAASRIIGNRIKATLEGTHNFGKSVTDPTFKGAAV
jgi:phage head maturation protease